MTTASEQGFGSWLAEETGGGPDWLQAQRAAALEHIRAIGTPTSKREAWRYTSLTRLLEAGFRPAATAPTPAVPDLDEVLVSGLVSHRAVLVNGRFEPGLSDLGGLPEGVRISGLRQALAGDPHGLRGHLGAVLGADPSHPTALFSALNTAGLDDGLVVLAGAGVRLARPIEVIHLAVGEAGVACVAQPRLVLGLGADTRVTLIERYLGRGCAPYAVNAVVEAGLEQGAVLAHSRIQTEGPAAFHLSGVHLAQGAGSRYRGLNLALGAAWSRTEVRVQFTGGHAECDLAGLYLAGDGQLSDIHLDVAHRLPNCTSREHFKGILYGKGRAVFDGRVVVARDAQRSDAAMTNRNLLLSEGAEVDTKPQLEINADDVKCSHGTTVGQIDPEQLFYLRSRGLGLPLARRMLCLGFAGEVLDGLTPEPLRAHVTEEVGRRLEQAPLD